MKTFIQFLNEATESIRNAFPEVLRIMGKMGPVSREGLLTPRQIQTPIYPSPKPGRKKEGDRYTIDTFSFNRGFDHSGYGGLFDSRSKKILIPARLSQIPDDITPKQRETIERQKTADRISSTKAKPVLAHEIRHAMDFVARRRDMGVSRKNRDIPTDWEKLTKTRRPKSPIDVTSLEHWRFPYELQPFENSARSMQNAVSGREIGRKRLELAFAWGKKGENFSLSDLKDGIIADTYDETGENRENAQAAADKMKAGTISPHKEIFLPGRYRAEDGESKESAIERAGDAGLIGSEWDTTKSDERIARKIAKKTGRREAGAFRYGLDYALNKATLGSVRRKIKKLRKQQ